MNAVLNHTKPSAASTFPEKLMDAALERPGKAATMTPEKQPSLVCSLNLASAKKYHRDCMVGTLEWCRCLTAYYHLADFYCIAFLKLRIKHGTSARHGTLWRVPCVVLEHRRNCSRRESCDKKLIIFCLNLRCIIFLSL